MHRPSVCLLTTVTLKRSSSQGSSSACQSQEPPSGVTGVNFRAVRGDRLITGCDLCGSY